jgi:Ca-activated chloride channel family protein
MFRINSQLGLVFVLVGVPGILFITGCPPAPAAFNTAFGPSAGDFGATQGGVQDMGFARELVASGQVPPPEAFVVEGMFSEHELGLAGDACERVLCLRTAVGVAPTLEGDPCGWMQVGLSSTIDPDTFQRPTLTLIATMDVSGSMGWDYATESTEYPTPGQVTRNLLSAIAAELGPQDRIALVTYGTEVHTVLSLTPGDQQVTIQAAIDSLSTGGVTDMESGLRRAYEIARTANGETEQVRLMLFTDLQPNVGATEPSAFEEMAADGANAGVGLTVMGVGVGLRQEIMNAITHLRGGNAFSLFDDEDVTELMADDWPFLVSPIAYDMVVDVTPSAGFNVAETYGFPSSDEEVITTLDVSTVFLSRRKGALLLRVEPESGTDLNGMSLSGSLTYVTPEGEQVEEDVETAYAGEPVDDRGQYFEQQSVGKTVALALLVSSMHETARLYGEDREQSIAIMRGALARFSADAESLADEALAPEVDLAHNLLALMEQGAEQGDLYGPPSAQ